jgi:hypothetical protein
LPTPAARAGESSHHLTLGVVVQIRRPWLVVALVAAIAAIPTAAVATHLFTDVSDTDVHARGIEFVADSGITAGCDAGRFCPSESVTRSQLATFLHRSSGYTPEVGPVANALLLDDTFYAENFEILTLDGGEAGECVSAEPIGVELGLAIVTHQLVSSPGGTDLSPAAINVAVDYDHDPSPGAYGVCFQTLDGSPLPAGEYETIFRLSVLFDDAAGAATAGSGGSADLDVLRAAVAAKSPGGR